MLTRHIKGIWGYKSSLFRVTGVSIFQAG